MTPDDFKNKYIELLRGLVNESASVPGFRYVPHFLKDTDELVRTVQRHVTRPKYKHDCKYCTFLAQHGEFDLYHCTQGINVPTVIARFGDEDRDYTSGAWGPRTEDRDATPPQIALRVAYLIAKDRRLSMEPTPLELKPAHEARPPQELPHSFVARRDAETEFEALWCDICNQKAGAPIHRGGRS